VKADLLHGGGNFDSSPSKREKAGENAQSGKNARENSSEGKGERVVFPLRKRKGRNITILMRIRGREIGRPPKYSESEKSGEGSHRGKEKKEYEGREENLTSMPRKKEEGGREGGGAELPDLERRPYSEKREGEKESVPA